MTPTSINATTMPHVTPALLFAVIKLINEIGYMTEINLLLSNMAYIVQPPTHAAMA